MRLKPRAIALAVLFSIAILGAYIESLDPQPQWWQDMHTWLRWHVFADSQRPEKAPAAPAVTPESPTKAVERTGALDTPNGPMVINKYSGDTCLYVRATVPQANYYGGLERLKKLLKEKYSVNCVLWQ